MRILSSLAAALFTFTALAACSKAPTLRSVSPTANTYFKARVPHFPTARFFGDKPAAEHAFDLTAWRKHRLPEIRNEKRRNGAAPTAHILLLSGGGPDGAYGAGVLNGWTHTGDRPVFDIVTGVSVGALMAPYAFLGSRYDGKIKDMFLTRKSSDDVFVSQLLGPLFGALSIADISPLKKLIDSHVDETLLTEIAAEHKKGRRLFVSTTYLDAKRPVTWNMGEIAASKHKDKLTLFKQVLLASAAIPGIAEPVYIASESGGRKFSEMHVDGGVMNSIAFVAPTLKNGSLGFPNVQTSIWIIQNNKLRAPFHPVADSFTGILSETVSELIRSQSKGDHARLYYIAERFNMKYRLSALQRDFKAPTRDAFSQTYAKALYHEGYRLADAKKQWRREPPSYKRLRIAARF